MLRNDKVLPEMVSRRGYGFLIPDGEEKQEEVAE